MRELKQISVSASAVRELHGVRCNKRNFLNCAARLRFHPDECCIAECCIGAENHASDIEVKSVK